MGLEENTTSHLGTAMENTMPPPHWQCIASWNCNVIMVMLCKLASMPCHACLASRKKVMWPPSMSTKVVATKFAEIICWHGSLLICWLIIHSHILTGSQVPHIGPVFLPCWPHELDRHQHGACSDAHHNCAHLWWMCHHSFSVWLDFVHFQSPPNTNCVHTTFWHIHNLLCG